MNPITVLQSTRTACEIVANTFAIQAPLLQMVRGQSEKVKFEVDIRGVLESLKNTGGDLSEIFIRHLEFTKMFRSMGLALVMEGQLQDLAGLTPRKDDIERIAVWVKNKMESEGQTFYVTDELSLQESAFSEFKELASGVFAIVLPARPAALLMLFRPEQITTFTWGGDPRKQLSDRNFQGQINPRLSFKAWDEQIERHSLEWCDYEIEGLKFLSKFML